MQWFYNMKIAKKLILSFGLMAVLAGVVGYVGITELKAADASDTVLYEMNTVPLSNMGEVVQNFQLIRIATREMLLFDSNAEVQKQADKIKEFQANLDKQHAEFEKSISSEEMRKLNGDLSKNYTLYQEGLSTFVSLCKNGKKTEAYALLRGPMTPPTNELVGIMDRLEKMCIDQAKTRSDGNTVAADAAMRTMIIILIIAVAAAMGLGIFISRTIANPLKVLADNAEKLAVGDINVNVVATTTDEIGGLTRSFGKMIESIRSLVSEAGMLSKDAVEGKLDTRGNVVKFQGAYREIVAGVNDTLDAVIGPLNVAAEFVDRISKGDIPPKITDTYRGDFNEIKNNLNQCIDAVNQLVTDANMLAKAAVEGKLATRADASKHQGDFRKIVQGVDDTLDAVIGPLNVAANYVERISKGDIPAKITDNYNGDFNAIKNNLNQCIDAVRLLVSDANMLSQAAVEGRLATRADATKHEGDFRKIVQGVNDTLDAVIEPVNEAVGCIEQMSAGDLTVRVNGDYKGDLAKMKNALNATLDALNDILGQVNTASEQVVSGSAQVSDASQSLSQGATEQASSLEEITASMTEMNSQTKQNAENAQQANKLAASARDNAQTGNERMREMLGAMKEINESSGQISKIIKVIDEIAFQTNLLALNAAVEAARAGVHGKGFAVVADEVRNLAQRSAKAAKETTELIENSIKKVDNGTGIANETAKALNEIVSGVTKVTDLVGEIASASNEQAQGIAQVNQGLGQVDQVTQANTANAEESAAASEELSGQARELQQMITRFKLTSQSGMRMGAYGSEQILHYAQERKPNGGNGNGNGKQKGGLAAALEGKKPARRVTASKSAGEFAIVLDDNEFGKF